MKATLEGMGYWDFAYHFDLKEKFFYSWILCFLSFLVVLATQLWSLTGVY